LVAVEPLVDDAIVPPWTVEPRGVLIQLAEIDPPLEVCPRSPEELVVPPKFDGMESTFSRSLS
jgi:hypothetical protein